MRTTEHNTNIAKANITRMGPLFKVCPACNELKAEGDFGFRNRANVHGLRYLNSKCKTCTAAVRPKLSPEYQRKHHLYAKYKIREADYERMLNDQGGGCAVCKTTKPGPERIQFFHVDHDHQTGAVRGLLCSHCNHAIGHANDDPERLRALAEYLEHVGHTTRVVRDT